MNRILSACGLLGISVAATAAQPLVDVPKLAGQTKAAVAAKLGPPAACELGKYGEKCRYEKPQVEIVFIKGKADWITVHAVAGRPYGPEIIELLGFKPTAPTFSTQHTIRWKNLDGILEANVAPGLPGQVQFVHFKVATP